MEIIDILIVVDAIRSLMITARITLLIQGNMLISKMTDIITYICLGHGIIYRIRQTLNWIFSLNTVIKFAGV